MNVVIENLSTSAFCLSCVLCETRDWRYLSFAYRFMSRSLLSTCVFKIHTRTQYPVHTLLIAHHSPYVFFNMWKIFTKTPEHRTLVWIVNSYLHSYWVDLSASFNKSKLVEFYFHNILKIKICSIFIWTMWLNFSLLRSFFCWQPIKFVTIVYFRIKYNI